MTRSNTGNLTSPDTGRRPVLRSAFLPLIAALCVMTLALVVSGLAAEVIDNIHLIVTSGAGLSERANPIVESSETLYLVSWVDPDAPQITGKVRIVNRATGKLIQAIDTGYAPDIAISPDGQRLYLAALEYIELTPEGQEVLKDYLTAFDTATWKAVWKTEIKRPPDANARFRTNFGDGPSALAISSDGSRLFVQLQGGWDAWLIRIDTATGRAIAQSPRVSNCIGADVTVSSNSNELHLSCYAGKALHFMNATTLQVEKTLSIPGGPIRSALSPDGRWLYVVTYASKVALIDLEKRSIEGWVDLGNDSSPVVWGSVTFSGNGSKLFVGVRAAGSDTPVDAVRVFDTQSWQQIGLVQLNPLHLDGGLSQLGVSRDQNRLLLLLQNEHVENNALHNRTSFSTVDLTRPDVASPLKLDLADNEQLVRFVVGP